MEKRQMSKVDKKCAECFVSEARCVERRGYCVRLIEEKLNAIKSQIKIGFSVATVVIVLVEFALTFWKA